MADPMLELIENVPDSDLMALYESIKSGAKSPAESFGFTPAALNTIEQMALAFYRGKKYGQAATLYGFVLKMDIKRASAWRGLGAVCQAQKQYALAVRCYDAALAQDPDDIISMVLCGECLCQTGDREVGLKILEDAIAKGTERPEAKAYITRARAIVGAKGGIPPRIVLMRQGKQLAADAEAMLAQGPVYDPDRPLTAQDIRRDPKLSALFDELKQMVNNGTLTFAELGGFTENELNGAYACAAEYAQMGRIAEALQICGLLQFVDPYKGHYYQLTGICLQRMKQYELAAQYYKISQIFDENNARTMLYRGECLVMLGQVDEGLAMVRKSVELARGTPEQEELTRRGQALLQQFERGA